MVKKDEVLEYLRRNPGALDGEFKIRSARPTTRKTFEVEQEVVKDFMDEAKRRKLKIKEAIDQALRAWIAKGK